MLSLSKINEKIRQQQKLLIVSGTVIGVSSITAFVMLHDARKNASHESPPSYEEIHLGPIPADKKKLTRFVNDTIATQNESIASLRQQIASLRRHIQKLASEKENEKAKESNTSTRPTIPPRNPYANSPSRKNLSFAWDRPTAQTTNTEPIKSHGAYTRAMQPKLTRLTLVAREKTRIEKTIDPDVLVAPKDTKETNDTYEYIPAGSFVRGTLLSGVYAPTGGRYAQQAMPVVISLDQKANLPNDFDARLTDCRVTGNAAADISSERALIRLRRLSCVAPTGQTFEQKVKGYVVGPDGKVGIRGALVTRSGQAISQSILVGLLSGFGKALSLSTREVYTYGNGTTSRRYSNSLEAGLGQGTSDAFRKISDYYLRLANKIFPVLEINGGIAVDLVFSQGVKLTKVENQPQ